MRLEPLPVAVRLVVPLVRAFDQLPPVPGALRLTLLTDPRDPPPPPPRPLRVGGRLGQDEQQGQRHRRARAERREPTIPGLHQRPPFGAVSGGAASPASGRFIACASIFCAPSGASNVKSPSGTLESRFQRRMTALYCGSPGSCT